MTDKPSFHLFAILVGILGFAAPASLHAAEQTGEYRVVGLFSPDRESDLRKAMADMPDIHLVHVDFQTARATFGYDLKYLFPTLNPKKLPTDTEIEQALSHLLGEASNQTFTLRACPKIPDEKLTKVEIKIGILDCRGCRYGVHLMVMKEEGVEQATVVGNLLTAWIDPAKTSQGAIEAMLKKAGVIPAQKK